VKYLLLHVVSLRVGHQLTWKFPIFPLVEGISYLSQLNLNLGNGLRVRVHCLTMRVHCLTKRGHCLIHLAHKLQHLILKVRIRSRRLCGLRLQLWRPVYGRRLVGLPVRLSLIVVAPQILRYKILCLKIELKT
jgi:hypothetical protein